MLSPRDLAVRTILGPPADPLLWQHSLESCWSEDDDVLPHPWRGLVAFDLARLALHLEPGWPAFTPAIVEARDARGGGPRAPEGSRYAREGLSPPPSLAAESGSQRSYAGANQRALERLMDWLLEASSVSALGWWPNQLRGLVLAHQGDMAAAATCLDACHPASRSASRPEPASVDALAVELARVAITGRLAGQPPQPLHWGRCEDWALLHPARPSLGMPIPTLLLIEEFRELQRRGGAELFFCLPPAGTAWIRSRHGPPQRAYPQTLRVLSSIAELGRVDVDRLREQALGPESQPTAIDKALSRTRRLLDHLGVPSESLQREGSDVVWGPLPLVGLVSARGRRPDVRVRGASSTPPAHELIGWAATEGGQSG